MNCELTDRQIVSGMAYHLEQIIRFTIRQSNLEASLIHQRHYRELSDEQRHRLAVCEVGAVA